MGAKIVEPFEDHKTCAACKQVKPFEDYDKDKHGRFGLQTYCRTCSTTRQRTYKQEIKAREGEDFFARKSREWRERNPEKYRAGLDSVRNRRAIDDTYREADIRRSAEWQRNNPERRAATRHKRRTQITAAGGSYTQEEWAALLDATGHRCLACGCADCKLTADHIVPVARGGPSWISNIQPLCKPCNLRKATADTDYRQEVTNAPEH